MSARILASLVMFALLGACDQDMRVQPKYQPFEAAKLFANGRVMQTPPPGTVARGDLAWDAALETRPKMTEALLARGRERYEIFCSPCHGLTGYGDGAVPRRGFPHPPSYHSERLRQASDEHFLDVIADGYGAMYSYAARVPPKDRWAILAYIRALQLSQHAPLAMVPQGHRDDLERPAK